MKEHVYHPLPNGQFFSEELLSLMINLSKSSKILFNELRWINLQLNIFTLVDIDKLSKNEQSSFHRSMRQLKKVDLIRKVISFEINSKLSNLLHMTEKHIPKKHTYMINPYIMKPLKFNLAKQIWDLIEPIKEKE